MGENKGYMILPEENGSIHIAEEVIAAITVGAVRDVEGVRYDDQHGQHFRTDQP